MGKITKNCAAFVAALLFSATLLAQDFSFAYMSDVHISVGSQTVEDAKKCMADINKQKGLSFAIFAGDITEFGSDEEIKLAKEIFDELIIPDVMLNADNEVFLDDVTVEEVEKALNVKLRIVSESSGYNLVNEILNVKMK